jgi:hypothetical protein
MIGTVNNTFVISWSVYWWWKLQYSLKTTDLPHKLDICYYINSSRVKAITVGMTITTLIARVNQQWKSRATGNIEHKRCKTTTHPPPKKNPNTTIKKQHKAKKMRNIESTKQPEVTHVLPNSKQFLPLIRHPSCCLDSKYVYDTTICKRTQIT